AYLWYMNGVERIDSSELPADGEGRWRIVASGDFNRDGQTDIVWQHRSSRAARIWYMDEAGTTPSEVVPLASMGDADWRIVGSGDFNGDGETDVVWQNHISGAARVALMDGVGGTPAEVVPLEPSRDS